MNRVIAALKKIRIGQIFMVFLAGIFLLVSTACSSVQAKSPAGVGNPRTEVPGGTATSPDPSIKNNYKGGMNDFKDLDPRAEGDDGSGKAAALKENAQRNVIDQTGSLGENTKRTLDKKGENAEDLGKNLKSSAEDTKSKAQSTASDLTKETKQVLESGKDRTLGATRGLSNSASRTAEDVKAKVKNTAEDVKANAKGTASNLDSNISRTADSVKTDAKDTGNSLIDKAQQAVENAGDFVQGKLNQSGDAAQRAADTTSKNTLNKVGNAINDALE